MISPLISYLETYHLVAGEDQWPILGAFEKRTVAEGEVLFKGGRVCTEMFFVEEGVLRIVKPNAKGGEVTYFFIGEMQFCTILASFDGAIPAAESIQAATGAEVLVISKARLDALYQEVPYLRTIIDRATHERLLKKVQLRNSYLGLDAAARYQLFLNQQADIAYRVSMKDIASYLEITPQSLSRIRGKR